MKLKALLLLVVGILIGMGIQAALAKGTPDKVVISSPDLPSDIVISGDTCMLNALSFGNLEDPNMLVNGTPRVEGDGYLISRYFGGQVFDQVRFYPDPIGGYGYVHDLGGVESTYAGQWFRPTPLSELMMEYLLQNSSPQATEQAP